MASASGTQGPITLLYDSNSHKDIQYAFVIILEQFKQLSPAIHERLQKPEKMFGTFGPPKSTGKTNEYEYSMNTTNIASSRIKFLKDWYKVVNIILDDINLKEYVIPEVRDLLPRFRTEDEVNINLKTVYEFVNNKFLGGAGEPSMREQGVLLNNKPFYVVHALFYLMDNFPGLEICSYERLKTLSLNVTKNTDKTGKPVCYDITGLRSMVNSYNSILLRPKRGMDEVIRELKKISKSIPETTPGLIEDLHRRLAALSLKGGRRRTRSSRRSSRTKRRTSRRGRIAKR